MAFLAFLPAVAFAVLALQTAFAQQPTIEITSFPKLNDPAGVIGGRVAGLANPTAYQAALAVESAYAEVWSSVNPQPLDAQGAFSFGGGGQSSGVYFRNAKINILSLSAPVPRVLNEPFPTALDASSVAIGLYPRDYAEPAAQPQPTAIPVFTQLPNAPGIQQPGGDGGGAAGGGKQSKLGLVIGLSVGGAAVALIALVVAGVVLTRRYNRAVKGRVLGAGETAVRSYDDQQLLAQTSAAARIASSPIAGSSDNLTGRGRTLTGSSLSGGTADTISGGTASAGTGGGGGGGGGSGAVHAIISPAIGRGGSSRSYASGVSRRSQPQLPSQSGGRATGSIDSEHLLPARSLVENIERSSSGRPLVSPTSGGRGLGR